MSSSMSITKNILCNSSAAIPYAASSSPFARGKVSRVCFLSGSTHFQAQQGNGVWPRGVKESERRRRNLKVKAEDKSPGATADDFVEKAKEKAEELKANVSASLESLSGDAGNKAKEAKEFLEDQAKDLQGKNKENVDWLAGKSEEAQKNIQESGGSVADKAKEYAEEAKEKNEKAATRLGEAAQESAEKLKEAVSGGSDGKA